MPTDAYTTLSDGHPAAAFGTPQSHLKTILNAHVVKAVCEAMYTYTTHFDMLMEAEVIIV